MFYIFFCVMWEYQGGFPCITFFLAAILAAQIFTILCFVNFGSSCIKNSQTKDTRTPLFGRWKRKKLLTKSKEIISENGIWGVFIRIRNNFLLKKNFIDIPATRVCYSVPTTFYNFFPSPKFWLTFFCPF